MGFIKLSSQIFFLLSFLLITPAYAETSLWRMGKLTVILQQEEEMISLRDAQQEDKIIFKGKISGDKIIGNAFHHRANCTPTPYPMSGEIIEKQKLVLHGAVPVFEKGECTPSFFSMGAPGWAYGFDYIRPFSHN